MNKHIIILLLSVILPYVLFSECKSGEDAIVLIPSGYKGVVYINLNQANGEKILYQDGKRVYRIPSNGILNTQFNNNEGIINDYFYYIDEKGNKIQLQPYDRERNLNDSNKVFIFGYELGTKTKFGNHKSTIDFIRFIVCTPKDDFHY